MSRYATIYSPTGEKFEVGEEKAADLVLNHGWSNIPPAMEPEQISPESSGEEDVNDSEATTFSPRRKGRGRT